MRPVMKGSLSTVKVTIVTFSTTPLEPRMSHTPSRREFIIKVASVSAAVTAGASLSACGGSSAQPEFLYGVASGDPLATQVILWTHAK